MVRLIRLSHARSNEDRSAETAYYHTHQEESEVTAYDLDLILGLLQAKGLCATRIYNDDDAVCKLSSLSQG